MIEPIAERTIKAATLPEGTDGDTVDIDRGSIWRHRSTRDLYRIDGVTIGSGRFDVDVTKLIIDQASGRLFFNPENQAREKSFRVTKDQLLKLYYFVCD